MIDKEKFFDFLDNINSIIDISLNNSLENNSGNLEIEILTYIQKNYPCILVPKDRILELINSGYKSSTEKFKKDIEFKVADTKYNLTGNNIELDDVLQKEIEKLNKVFYSISLGSNINYLDYIKNTLGNIMKYIMEKGNNSISFAKKSMEIRQDIEKMIDKYFRLTMNDYGESLKEKLGNRVNI